MNISPNCSTLPIDNIGEKNCSLRHLIRFSASLSILHRQQNYSVLASPSKSFPIFAKHAMASASRPFLSLPNEIRERIYGYALTVNVDDPKPWISPLGNELRPEPARSSCLAILVTCRQILLEAFHVFYVFNTFNFNHPHHLCDFLKAIGPVRANEIRSIRCSFKLDASKNTAARYALSKLARLEKLAFQYDNEEPSDNPGSVWRPYVIHKDFCSHKEFTKINGLREVSFILMYDTEPSRSDKARMEMYRDLMIKPNPKLRKTIPDMVDLFVRLKIRKQRDLAVAQKRKMREENEAWRKSWAEANRKVQQRVKLEMLWRRGEAARREQDHLNVDGDTDEEGEHDLADFLSSESWIRGAILG